MMIRQKEHVAVTWTFLSCMQIFGKNRNNKMAKGCKKNFSKTLILGANWSMARLVAVSQQQFAGSTFVEA